MNGTKDRCKPIYFPLFQSRDIKIHYLKYGKKENWTNTGKNKHENAGSRSHDAIHHYQPVQPNMTTRACMVLQQSLTKNFNIQNMERKKIGQIQERISIRRLVHYLTIQFIIINLHSKYDNSSLHSFTEIFDEKFHHSKYGKKEMRTNIGMNKHQKTGSQSHHTSSSTCIPSMITLACMVSQISLTKNFITQSMERKKIGQVQGRKRKKCWFTIP